LDGGTQTPAVAVLSIPGDACVRVANRGDGWRDDVTNGENGRVQYDADGELIRNANGDLIRQDVGQEYYCGSCRTYIGPTGERVEYESKDVILWIECDWCLTRRLEQETLEAKHRARAEAWNTPRLCQLEECRSWFEPRAAQQRFCTPEHRWMAARRRAKSVA
jgi:hypothetical protein